MNLFLRLKDLPVETAFGVRCQLQLFDERMMSRSGHISTVDKIRALDSIANHANLPKITQILTKSQQYDCNAQVNFFSAVIRMNDKISL